MSDRRPVELRSGRSIWEVRVKGLTVWLGGISGIRRVVAMVAVVGFEICLAGAKKEDGYCVIHTSLVWRW